MVFWCLLEHVAQDGGVRCIVADRAEGQPEGVGHKAGKRRLAQTGNRRSLGDGDCGDTRFIQTPLEQSDRLLADRSGGDQKREVRFLVSDLLHRGRHGASE